MLCFFSVFLFFCLFGQNDFFPCNTPLNLLGGIELEAFPKGPRARPLDHRRSLIRSTCWNIVRQSSYLPSVLKIVLELLTIISVLQIVLLYYPRSTVPRCANMTETQWFHAEDKERDGMLEFQTWIRLPLQSITPEMRAKALGYCKEKRAKIPCS